MKKRRRYNMGLKIFLDDDALYRSNPTNFLRFYSGEELIQFFENELNQNEIDYISFDNDLGQDILEGYDVVKYMMNHNIQSTEYNIHSANNVAASRMKSYIESAIKMKVVNNAKITMLNNQELLNKFK